MGHAFAASYQGLLATADPVTPVCSYLLLSQKTAQTHWHVDFSGTSVFYLLVEGAKDFYVLKPTNANRDLLEAYHSSETART